MITLHHSPVHSNPEVMSGVLVFRNTRVPAQTLLDYVDDGISLKDFLNNFPSVQKDDALAFLNLVREQENENYSR